MSAILSGVEFNAQSDFVYTKPKLTKTGGKQIGVLNAKSMKGMYMSTPLMLTWGVNDYTNEITGAKTFDLALQFPNDEYNNPACVAFLKNMQEFETKIKLDAIANSKDWLNKSKLVPDAVDALWTPMLKYPKDKETGDFDYARAPTLKVKIPYWEGEFKNVELYNDSQEMIFPSDDTDDAEKAIKDMVVKASHVATIIQCGGLWVANGKFGITWRLFQAVVKPRATLSGRCHITLTTTDKAKMAASVPEAEDDVPDINNLAIASATQVEDSDEEDDVEEVKAPEKTVPSEVKAAVQEEVKAKTVVTEDVPKKKRVVKKKAQADE
jgi:hypothetical protein